MLAPINIHTHTHIHSQTHTHSFTHKCTHLKSNSFNTHIPFLSGVLSVFHKHTYSAFSQTCTHVHTNKNAHTHIQTHKHTHTYTHTQTTQQTYAHTSTHTCPRSSIHRPSFSSLPLALPHKHTPAFSLSLSLFLFLFLFFLSVFLLHTHTPSLSFSLARVLSLSLSLSFSLSLCLSLSARTFDAATFHRAESLQVMESKRKQAERATEAALLLLEPSLAGTVSQRGCIVLQSVAVCCSLVPVRCACLLAGMGWLRLVGS